MTSIWASDDSGWHLLAPVGFPDEKALHRLVEESPELLPLSGAPRLIVLGREVPLGSGYADLLAVEPSGRLVLIEVKLASNAEARRAVVAQILAYAAYLRGTDPATLEGEILRSNLLRLKYSSIADAAAAEDPDGSFDAEIFTVGVSESLDAGRFRLVLVLDDAPAELVRLVGYLEFIAPELVIDLVSVSAYDVNGSRVLVPQRIDSERPAPRPNRETGAGPVKQGYLIPADEFEAGITHAPAEAQQDLERLYRWARSLERDGLARLLAYRGVTGRTTLLPYVPSDEAGLVTIWNDGGFYVSLWRSVFERHAPGSISAVEALIAPIQLGRGNTIKAVSDELLIALRSAYEEAAA